MAKAAGIVGLYMAPPGNAIVLAMNASKHVSPIVHRPFMHLRWGARYAFALGHPLNLSSRITVAGHRDLVTREEFEVVAALAQKARAEQEILTERLTALEAQLVAHKPEPAVSSPSVAKPKTVRRRRGEA